MSEIQKVRAILRWRGKDDPVVKHVKKLEAELAKKTCDKAQFDVLEAKVKKLQETNDHLFNIIVDVERAISR